MSIDPATLILIFFGSILAACSGTGGGAIYMPIFLTLGSATTFIPLSKAVVFGVAVAYYIMNHSKQRVPEGEFIRPLIAYDIALLLEPPTLAGTIFGARLNKIMPYWLTSIIMLPIMSYILYKTVKKGLSMREKEMSEDIPSTKHPTKQLLLIDSVKKSSDSQKDLCGPLHDNEEIDADAKKHTTDSKVEKDEESLSQEHHNQVSIRKIIDTRQYPLDKIFAFVVCWISVLISTLLSGGESTTSIPGISCGGYTKEASDVHWSWSNVKVILAVCTLAGILSGAVGLGGSTIKGPFLHHLLHDASVSKATSCFMLLSTVSASTLIFIWIGTLDPINALIHSSVGFAGGLIGIQVMTLFMKKYNRKSYIVLFLAAYIALALATLTILTVIKDLEDIGVISGIDSDDRDPHGIEREETGFHPLCEKRQAKGFW
ncbi:hypothetical protein AAMO2058_000682100 [Amorphochlora amoebiformis]